MTTSEYQEYIRRQLVAIAASKYSHDDNLQLVYQIGFLQAQLADAMYNDSRVADRFKMSIEQAKQ